MSSKQKKKTSSSSSGKKKTSSSSNSGSNKNKAPKPTPKPQIQAPPPTESDDQKKIVYPSWDIRLGDSELEGLGVFAARNFKKGEIVEICPYLQIFKGHMDDECEVGDYTFDFDDESEVLMLGYGSMYNHHKDNNLDYLYDEETDMFEYSTLRDIKKGEELTVNYGDPYWEAREEDPK